MASIKRGLPPVPCPAQGKSSSMTRPPVSSTGASSRRRTSAASHNAPLLQTSWRRRAPSISLPSASSRRSTSRDHEAAVGGEQRQADDRDAALPRGHPPEPRLLVSPETHTARGHHSDRSVCVYLRERRGGGAWCRDGRISAGPSTRSYGAHPRRSSRYGEDHDRPV